MKQTKNNLPPCAAAGCVCFTHFTWLALRAGDFERVKMSIKQSLRRENQRADRAFYAHLDRMDNAPTMGAADKLEREFYDEDEHGNKLNSFCPKCGSKWDDCEC